MGGSRIAISRLLDSSNSGHSSFTMHIVRHEFFHYKNDSMCCLIYYTSRHWPSMLGQPQRRQTMLVALEKSYVPCQKAITKANFSPTEAYRCLLSFGPTTILGLLSLFLKISSDALSLYVVVLENLTASWPQCYPNQLLCVCVRRS
jgi:hypothetical protein